MDLPAGVAASSKPPSPMKRAYWNAFPQTMPPPSTPTPGSSAKKKQKRSKESVARTKDVSSMKAKMYKVYEYLLAHFEECGHKMVRDDPVKATGHRVFG